MNGKKLMKKLICCSLLCAMSLCLAACPPKIDPEWARTGEYFRRACMRRAEVRYQVLFDTEVLPNVIIEYRTAEGEEKRACFEVDGYDLEKNIAYKMVTQADKEKWDKARAEGEDSAPDLADAKLIQKAALQNAVPTLFVCVYSYQNETEREQMIDNWSKISSEVGGLLDSPELSEWVQQFGQKIIPERLPSPTPKPTPKYWEQ